MSLVLVTGANGFIGAWCVAKLLERGGAYRVRGTVRDPASPKNAFLRGLPGASESTLELVKADLNSDDGWDAAVAGCEYVLHVASPYVLTVRDAQKDLVDPAVNGTLRVLRAAKAAGTVKRVVLTSSVAAVSDCFDEFRTHVYDEKDFNETSSLTRNPYYYSKVRAEKAAWDFVKNQSPGFDFCVVNPFLVIGPALDTSAALNESVEGVIAMPMRGKLPMIVDVYNTFVDVRDVAEMHVRAMTEPAAANRRFIGVAREEGMHAKDSCRVVHDAAPKPIKSRVPTKFIPVPGFVVKTFVRLTQPKGAADYVATNLGKRPRFDNSPARDVLKMEFRDPVDSIKDTVKWLVENKKVV